jgi:hypothetical protein
MNVALRLVKSFSQCLTPSSLPGACHPAGNESHRRRAVLAAGAEVSGQTCAQVAVTVTV